MTQNETLLDRRWSIIGSKHLLISLSTLLPGLLDSLCTSSPKFLLSCLVPLRDKLSQNPLHHWSVLVHQFLPELSPFRVSEGILAGLQGFQEKIQAQYIKSLRTKTMWKYTGNLVL